MEASKMKRFIIGISLVLILGIIGCGRNTQNATDVNDTDVEKQTEIEEDPDFQSKFKFPEGQSQVGEGIIYVSTPDGTSENNNIPEVMVDKDTTVTQIGLNAENFDGSKISYVYINEKFVEKIQLGEMTQTTLELQGEFLNPGIYTVSVVQFDNDDPETGKVTQFAETQYEIKGLQ